MGRQLNDQAVAMNIAKHIMQICESIERKPKTRQAVQRALKNQHYTGNLAEFALDNIIGIYEQMMAYDHLPYPQAIEFYDRLNFLKDGQILDSTLSARRFSDKVREVTPTDAPKKKQTPQAKKDFGMEQYESAQRVFKNFTEHGIVPDDPDQKSEQPEGEKKSKEQIKEEMRKQLPSARYPQKEQAQRKQKLKRYLPPFFNIIVDVCGPASKEVKDITESWMTLNIMMHQPNISGPAHGKAAYKRVWYNTAAAMQDRVKEINAQIANDVVREFRENQRQTKGKPSSHKATRARAPFSEAAQKSRANKARPVPQPDASLIDQKIIKVKSYGIMRSKLRNQMNRHGDAFEDHKRVAREAIMEDRKDDKYQNPPSALDGMIGMDEIKMNFVRERAILLKEQINLRFRPDQVKHNIRSRHKVFKGEPGTGKSTAALALGQLYKDMGILKSGHVVRVTRDELCGTHIGQTAPKTKEVIERALNGVLVVDEAYMLYSSSENDYGREAIGIILDAMETERDRLVVVFAGYPDEMDQLMQINPGLLSRFNKVYNFPDYSDPELMQILDTQLKSYGLKIEDKELRNKIEKQFAVSKAKLGRNFGNARFVRNFAEKLDEYQSARLMESGIISPDIMQNDTEDADIKNLIDNEISEITLDDVMAAFKDTNKAAIDNNKNTEKPIGFDTGSKRSEEFFSAPEALL